MSTDKPNFSVNDHNAPQNVALAHSRSTVDTQEIRGGTICFYEVQHLALTEFFFMGFPHSSVSKESACNAGDLGLIPGSGRSPGKGNGSSLQYSCLENPMDRGAWQATVHGVVRVGHDLVTKPLNSFYFILK